MPDLISKTFHDVEHEGDAEEITNTIYANGGKITYKKLDHEGEYLELTFEVPDKKKFWEAVKGLYYWD